MLLPIGSIVYEGGWKHGLFDGDCVMETFDSSSNLLLRFCGVYRENKRTVGAQEWFEGGVVSRRFQGTWDGAQPATGVWGVVEVNDPRDYTPSLIKA